MEPAMKLPSRRECLRLAAGAAAAAAVAANAAADPKRLGIPGLFPGRVVAVEDQKCIRRDAYQTEPIRAMVDRGMCELTGAAKPADAWASFFSPGDVVGIKASPIGRPFVSSSPAMIGAIIDGLASAGVKTTDIVLYERYRVPFYESSLPNSVPAGVRVTWAAEDYEDIQQGMDRYDPDHFVDLPMVLPQFSLDNPAARRSFAAQFISREVTKLINLPTLKSHNTAGVTLALKNLSHGLVNNVSRSHPRLSEFIPAVISMPVIRDKTVLHILDGTKGLYDGGPGIMRPDFVWEHKTVYFSTDPVAVDVIGRRVIDERRRKAKLAAVAMAKSKMQPEHIESCGKAGLGVSDPSAIDLRAFKLS